MGGWESGLGAGVHFSSSEEWIPHIPLNAILEASAAPLPRPLPTLPFPSLFKLRKFHNTLTKTIRGEQWREIYIILVLEIYQASKVQQYSITSGEQISDPSLPVHNAVVQQSVPLWPKLRKSFVILKVRTGNCSNAGQPVDTGQMIGHFIYHNKQPNIEILNTRFPNRNP